MSHQYKLFEYTKANDLLVGDDVVEADRIKRKIKALQSQKILTPNCRLDMIYRDPSVIGKVFVLRLEPGGALTDNERYAIVVAIEPSVIRPYDVPIAFFKFKKNAEAVLDTVQAYLRLRYGV
jgi:hypothetical protein